VQQSSHADCPHCGKKIKEWEANKQVVDELETEIHNLEKQSAPLKEIKKLIRKLQQLKEQQKMLRHEAFIAQVRCPLLKQLQAERKNCNDCRKQTLKKHVILINNSLIWAKLINEDEVINNSKAEMYLLSNENVCWYNKSDLFNFLTSESKTRNLLKDKNRPLTDLQVYWNKEDELNVNDER
jgi:DNA-binding transcriptional MerR regulator